MAKLDTKGTVQEARFRYRAIVFGPRGEQVIAYYKSVEVPPTFEVDGVPLEHYFPYQTSVVTSGSTGESLLIATRPLAAKNRTDWDSHYRN